jgi:hypothetical protein
VSPRVDDTCSVRDVSAGPPSALALLSSCAATIFPSKERRRLVQLATDSSATMGMLMVGAFPWRGPMEVLLLDGSLTSMAIIWKEEEACCGAFMSGSLSA